jgi:hypothetical protein
MEHVMKSGARGQLQANCDVVDHFHDAVGAEIARLQLPGGDDVKRGDWAVAEAE